MGAGIKGARERQSHSKRGARGYEKGEVEDGAATVTLGATNDIVGEVTPRVLPCKIPQLVRRA